MRELNEKRIKAYVGMAEALANEMSPDAETKVGAILISPTGRQIASGYNGFSSGADDDNLPKTRPDKYEYMHHAERNILYNCLDEGIRTRGCTIVCTLSPCLDCLRACYQSGIKTIVYRDLYHKFDNNNFYRELRDIYVDIGYIGKYTSLNIKSIKDSKDILKK